MKNILILLCIILICFLSSCNINNDNILIDIANTDSTDSIKTSTDLIKTSNSKLYDYDYFYNYIDDNTYDENLQNDLNDGVLMLGIVYGNYAKSWTNELLFTIDNAKVLFYDIDEYNLWKDNMQQWMDITKSIIFQEVQIQSEQSCGEMQRDELALNYANLIKEKTIDTKYFLYLIETGDPVYVNNDVLISLMWEYDK